VPRLPGGSEVPGPVCTWELEPLPVFEVDEAELDAHGKYVLTNPGRTGKTPLTVVRRIRNVATVTIPAFLDRRPE